ncbi:hypothetical protein MKZ38_003550 [Zalerion maritima]|uniref:NACHT domain-containing protein n=1 Tax=Zalerion maritima TaxID=339359 RepID=A0AAD5WRS0_9PEZI|nr:hypothetical protein MKZ38_003550 [Zalerion maritima]
MADSSPRAYSGVLLLTGWFNWSVQKAHAWPWMTNAGVLATLPTPKTSYLHMAAEEESAELLSATGSDWSTAQHIDVNAARNVQFAQKTSNEGGVHYNTTSHHYGTSSSPFQWLLDSNPVDFSLKQKQAYKIVTDENVDETWVLDSSVFKGWQQNARERTLWCYGDPGSGKTTLASIAIHYLLTRLDAKPMACVYVYFDYTDQIKLALPDILRSILAQLVRARPHAAPNGPSHGSPPSCRQDAQAATSRDLSKMLKVQIDEFFRAFIVVDGLDQCTDDDVRTELVRELQDLPKSTHILITSCEDNHLKKQIKPDAVFPVVSSDKYLRKYLENHGETAEKIKLLASAAKNHTWASVLDTVIQKSEGKFRLAGLHAKTLARQPTVDRFECQLENLSDTLDTFYDKAVAKIEAQEEFDYLLALSIFTWLIFAARPLTVPELQHAISLEKGDAELIKGGFIRSRDLTSVCAGLVAVDEKTNIVRLRHYSIKVYLAHKLERELGEAHSTVAKVCIEYLSLKQLEKPHPRTDQEMAARKERYPFLSYAADYWGHHIRMGVIGEVYYLAWTFLSSNVRLRGACRAMTSHHVSRAKGVTWLHLAIYFGIMNLAKKVLDKNEDFVRVPMKSCTGEGETPLHWAIMYDQTEFLRLLISKGANPNAAEMVKGRTPLHLAVLAGSYASVDALVSAAGQVDMDEKDKAECTPLLYAARSGEHKIVKFLLSKRANINISDRDGWTPLRHAAVQGHRKVVEILLGRGASLETAWPDKWSFLHWASKEGKDRFLPSLIERKVDLDATDTQGWTALRWAIKYGRAIVTWHLIEGGADINLADKDGLRPLHYAVEYWDGNPSPALIWLLLHRGVEVNARNKTGCAALHLACGRGLDQLVWLLLTNKAIVEAEDHEGHTPLHFAARSGHKSTMDLLLAHDADIQKIGKKDHSALHLAAGEGHAAMVRYLTEHGVPLDAKTKHGFTPLHLAAQNGRLDAAEFLVSRGADAAAGDNNFQTCLHKAVINNQVEAVKYLAKIPGRPSVLEARDDMGRTALHTAACEGHLELVKLLVGNGARRDARDAEGKTVLEVAEMYEEKQVVKYLNLKGAAVEYKE